MLKYFLEEEQPQAGEEIKATIKTHLIGKRHYTPFHLDCPHTKRKLCYCPAFVYSRTAPTNTARLWKTYQPVHDFYEGVQEAHIQRAAKMYHHCRDKIRKLSRAETAEFVRNLRSEKTLHMGENGEFQNL